jgi:uncharacterized protein YciI
VGVPAARTIWARTAATGSRYVDPESNCGREHLYAAPRDKKDQPMQHYLLFLDFADDYETRRPEFREAHLERAWAAAERGELILAGALTDPLDTGILLFQGESPAIVERFVREDAYVNNGLVRSWRIREWATVVGETASAPLRPEHQPS